MEAPGDQPRVNPVPLRRFISDSPTVGELHWQFVKISITSLLKLCNCTEGGDKLEMLH